MLVSLCELASQYIDCLAKSLNFTCDTPPKPYSTFHVLGFLVLHPPVGILSPLTSLLKSLDLQLKIPPLLLHRSYYLQCVVNQLDTYRVILLLTAFASWESFPLTEELAGFVQLSLQAGYALFRCDLVKGGPITQLPFELVDLLLCLNTETLNLLPLSLPPDLVEIA